MLPPKDPTKLTSIDAHGGHLRIIPAEVRGRFKRYRNAIHALLLLVFLGVPWMHHAGTQLVHVNFRDRELLFFGMIFKSHDAPLIFLVLITLILTLAFVTAVWGRVWCGWACPQTVFIEAVYRRVEIWIEGKYIERRRLDKAPMSFLKARRKTMKWLAFFVISAVFAHSLAAYFTGSYELMKMMQGSPKENWHYFLMIFTLTLILTFNFGWFREQFCVIMCPYGRIQSVLMEASTLSVVYDNTRGEPRRGVQAAGKPAGDCVSCNRCVEVCPTGIDIRNGLQMECIACTACIDSCDEIMEKVGRPPGLIRYDTLDGTPMKIWKAKTIVYAMLIVLAVGILALRVRGREDAEIFIVRAPEAPFVQTPDNQGLMQVINHFRIHLTNQTDRTLSYTLAISDPELRKNLNLVISPSPIRISPRGSETVHFFVGRARDSLPPSGMFPFKIQIQEEGGASNEQSLTFVGPPR
jgi:cytochrome c oxidase accessory protein FixG